MLGHFKIKSYICGKDSANRAQYKTNLFVFITEMKPSYSNINTILSMNTNTTNIQSAQMDIIRQVLNVSDIKYA